tara:strand:- start:2820 stop:3551 length:732 start_codon:yes stop_codon:yes gene_type:complete
MIKKKLISLVSATGLFLGTLTTGSNAGDTVSIGAGFSGGATAVEVYGQQKLLGSGALTGANETAYGAVGSYYGQISIFDGYFEDRWGTNGLTIGYESFAGEARVTGSRGDITDQYASEQNKNIGKNYVEGVFKNLRTTYIETPGFTPLGIYLKFGQSSMDVDTREELNTGSAFGNTSTDADTIGFGFKKSANGFHIKTEFNYSDWDDITLNPTHTGNGSAGGIDTVTVKPDNWTAKIGLGYSF